MEQQQLYELSNSMLLVRFKQPKKTIKDFNTKIVSNKKRLIKSIDRFHSFPELYPIMIQCSRFSLILLNTFNKHSRNGFARIQLKDLCYMIQLPIRAVKKCIQELVDKNLLFKNTFGSGINGKRRGGKITEFITPWHIHIYLSRFLLTKNGIPKRPTMPKQRLCAILNYALYLMPKRVHKDHKKTEEYRKLIHDSINKLLFPNVN